MHTVLASHFLAGAILTLVLPVGTLVAVGIYWALLLRRRSAGARSGRVD
jgi:hypothetical protein